MVETSTTITTPTRWLRLHCHKSTLNLFYKPIVTRLFWILGVVSLDAQQGYVGREEKLPMAVAPQPIPFSHRQHSAQGTKCHDCHGKAQTQERAGIPQATQCMYCHVSIRKDTPDVQRLAQLAAKKEPIPWVRVYSLPDFVFFSHSVHVKASVDCQTCHGPIAEREVLQKEVSKSMRMCVDCQVSLKASVDCSRCHELGQ